jgi:hypothetical protein
MQLDDLVSAHYGETIWVLGSGPSLNFLSPSFFDDKTTVSTNFSARTLGHYPDYAFTHYHANAASLLSDTGTVVTIEKDTKTGSYWSEEKPSNLVLAETPYDKAPGSSWDPITSHRPGPNNLVYGSSSLHGAMHLAAHLGASFIVLVGADCGTIDGEDRITGYPDGHKLWALYNRHHKLMKKYLEDNYPLKVYSLNPFINFNLEGHKFEGVE